MRPYVISSLLALALLVAGAPSARGASGSELLRLLDEVEKNYAEVHDYTSVLLARERIGGTLREQETVLLKFQRPFKVYMKWLDGPSKGREGLYVNGSYNGKFLVYEPRGILRLFTVALDPSDHRVMEYSRHPVTDVGIGRLIQIVSENARRGAKNGVLQIIDRGSGDVAGRRVRQVEGILPQDPKAGYYSYRVLLAFDEENHLPIRVAVYDWNDQLVEEYVYTHIQLNPELSDRDFDPQNTDYGFSGWRLALPG